jgi:Flp pilus assembly pilin Flp
LERFLKFFKDEDGLETVEYAVIAGLITVGTIVTILAIGIWVSVRFDAILTVLSGS